MPILVEFIRNAKSDNDKNIKKEQKGILNSEIDMFNHIYDIAKQKKKSFPKQMKKKLIFFRISTY